MELLFNFVKELLLFIDMLRVTILPVRERRRDKDGMAPTEFLVFFLADNSWTDGKNVDTEFKELFDIVEGYEVEDDLRKSYI